MQVTGGRVLAVVAAGIVCAVGPFAMASEHAREGAGQMRVAAATASPTRVAMGGPSEAVTGAARGRARPVKVLTATAAAGATFGPATGLDEGMDVRTSDVPAHALLIAGMLLIGLFVRRRKLDAERDR